MIFENKSGKRWVVVKSIFLIFLLLVLTLSTCYVLDHYGYYKFPVMVEWIHFCGSILLYIFVAYILVTIIIGFIRMFIIFYFVARQVRRKKIIHKYKKANRKILRPYRPFVSVIIPVYNEEVVIRRTIHSILKSNYPLLEILVVDDGSTDRTASIIRKEFAKYHRVHFIRKRNGGKSSALNCGIDYAIGDIIVTIDADTMFKKSTISYLVRQFSDPNVAAVSGNCKVGNIRNQVTLWQHIEYVTANNLDKRAFEEINAITIVPGSNSAWRKSVIQRVGYFEDDTLAEDTDLTLKVINSGYKIIYEHRAISYEEVPETIKDFLKQRFRWSYGILQAIWKHRKTIRKSNNKMLKYVAIPSLLYNYLLFLTMPIVDIMFIWALINGYVSIYIFALIFYLTDFLNSYVAFKVGKENKKPLYWIVVQRLAYRVFFAYITWKTFYRAIKGRKVGWTNLKRTGNNSFKS
ncbi:glycosyltransferase [Ureibacillus manganicus]|uniref:Glycosyltransferase 2-like domain-containing protein n=1 Tax=Ureibacillus manganicus DSM 26584 TaxID=1384049 RepID=A0A0A3I486_9BACL|nr:glycosyltransferase [Ureibacillus manganicus]KGR78295.1 hypothetical protein CD29_11265 [Ureibacillus manganicus DSM 26584]